MIIYEEVLEFIKIANYKKYAQDLQNYLQISIIVCNLAIIVLLLLIKFTEEYDET